MKKTAIVTLGVLLLGGLVWVVGFRGKDAGPKYRTAKVDKGSVTQTVTATGTLSAVITVKVGSAVSGNVAALHADFNKVVKKGDLLAELDPAPFQAKVEQGQAALQKAEVDARNADISLRRQAALKEQGLAPQADFDQAQANADSAKAAVAQAKATLEQATTDLRNSKIVAPIDGVVVDREYDVGQSVAASFQAPTIFTIAQDLTKMQVSADVSESDIGMCKVGQPVRFTVDAYPDQIFRGTISQIRLNATVNQNVVTYPGDHRRAEPRSGAAAEHDRQRHHRRRRRPRRAAGSERRAALPSRGVGLRVARGGLARRARRAQRLRRQGARRGDEQFDQTAGSGAKRSPQAGPDGVRDRRERPRRSASRSTSRPASPTDASLRSPPAT